MGCGAPHHVARHRTSSLPGVTDTCSQVLQDSGKRAVVNLEGATTCVERALLRGVSNPAW